MNFRTRTVHCTLGQMRSNTYDTRSSPETGAENRLHFSGTGFWSMSHANLGPDSFGTGNQRRLQHCSISKPETGMHVTEMMIYHQLLFTFVISCKQSLNSRVVIYLFIVIRRLRRFQPCIFSATEIFIPDAYGTKNRRQKMESIYGTSFWSVCHGYKIL